MILRLSLVVPLLFCALGLPVLQVYHPESSFAPKRIEGGSLITWPSSSGDQCRNQCSIMDNVQQHPYDDIWKKVDTSRISSPCAITCLLCGGFEESDLTFGLREEHENKGPVLTIVGRKIRKMMRLDTLQDHKNGRSGFRFSSEFPLGTIVDLDDISISAEPFGTLRVFLPLARTDVSKQDEASVCSMNANVEPPAAPLTIKTIKSHQIFKDYVGSMTAPLSSSESSSTDNFSIWTS